MRIKAVLRDSDILAMTPGSKERIIATARKNVDRFVNWRSLLKVMGLKFEHRLKMLDELKEQPLHIWLAKDADQHVIYLSEKDRITTDEDICAYMWQ